MALTGVNGLGTIANLEKNGVFKKFRTVRARFMVNYTENGRKKYLH